MKDFLLAAYPWFKVLHIVAVISWMAALFYLPRLFINQIAAEPGGEAEGMLIGMQRRLAKGIMTPAMIATWVFGLLIITAYPEWAGQFWFLLKFSLVVAMSGVHGFYTVSMKKFAVGERPRTDKFWRIINEVPVLMMIVVVGMVIFKPALW